MYKILIKRLMEEFDTNPLGLDAVENLRRVYLSCQYFPHMFEKQEDLNQAYQSMAGMMDYGKRNGLAIYQVAAQGLENIERKMRGRVEEGYVFSSFILLHLSKFIKCLEYLLDGDEEVEKTFPEGAKKAAIEVANKIVEQAFKDSLEEKRKELNRLFNQS